MDRDNYAKWMRLCLLLAKQACERGDAGVGAVIVFDNVIIAEASEQVNLNRDIAGHAELVAIELACKILGTLTLAGCTLITNVEPCWMCSYAIRETSIAKVIIGRPVEDIGGVTSRYPILTDATIDGWGPPPSIEWYGISDA